MPSIALRIPMQFLRWMLVAGNTIECSTGDIKKNKVATVHFSFWSPLLQSRFLWFTSA